jgi:hypothetical protein
VHLQGFCIDEPHVVQGCVECNIPEQAGTDQNLKVAKILDAFLESGRCSLLPHGRGSGCHRSHYLTLYAESR